MPPPSLLREYDAVYPGAAKVIVDAFRNQTEHRHHIEKVLIEGSNSRADLGLRLGFFIVVSVLGIGTWLVVAGYPAPGTVVLSVPLPTLAGVFVYGKRAQRREPRAKR